MNHSEKPVQTDAEFDDALSDEALDRAPIIDGGACACGCTASSRN